MNGIAYEFTDKDVSPWGGLRLVEETYRKSMLKDFLENQCTDFKEFFDELLTIIPKNRIGLVRADSGFYGNEILGQLEENQTNYIVATKMNKGLTGRIFQELAWSPKGDGYWTTSFDYQTKGWDMPRRMIVVRKDTGSHPETGGRLLFPEIEEFEQYKYAAYVTNMDLSAETIWHLYNKRADCENRNRELRNDYGIDGLCMDDLSPPFVISNE